MGVQSPDQPWTHELVYHIRLSLVLRLVKHQAGLTTAQRGVPTDRGYIIATPSLTTTDLRARTIACSSFSTTSEHKCL